MKLWINGNLENRDQEKWKLDIRKNGIWGKWILEQWKFRRIYMGKWIFQIMQIWKNENQEKCKF